MRRARLQPLLAAVAASALGAPALGGDPAVVETDPAGDAVVRRTDSCLCAPLNPGQTLPDLLGASASAWQAPMPASDPYSGMVTTGMAQLVRIDLRFGGVVNPPGPIGLGGQPYDPFLYGPSPVYGSLEIDVDREENTGGETSDVAPHRYLGNAARFGALPYRLSERAARSADDYYQPWTESPQLCLTSADWVLTLCGCFTPTIVGKSDPSHATFQAGDTWIVSGRFFQRTSAYKAASLMLGGSMPGAYDPVVHLRFSHSPQTNQTTVSLVYALTQVGAGLLAGPPPQQTDLSASNQTSIAEGVQDLIDAAEHRNLTGLARQVTIGWRDEDVDDATDPGDWRLYALFGTAYPEPADGLYVWTDVGFDHRTGDVNGDGLVSALDQQAVAAYIAATDGGPDDADGTVNGRVLLPPSGSGAFSVYDVNGDGEVGPADTGVTPTCAPDFDGQNGLDIIDIFAFLEAWFAGCTAPGPAPCFRSADYDGMDGVDLLDIFAFLEDWFAGCP